MNQTLPILLVEYHSADKTLKYLSELMKKSEFYQLLFVVVDNTPGRENTAQLCAGLQNLLQVKPQYKNPESIAYFVGEKAHAVLCHSNENLGYAKGNNRAFALAKEYAPDFRFAVISNNDLQLGQDFSFSQLLAPMKENTSISAVGPHIVDMKGKSQNPCRIVPLWKRYGLYSLIWPLNKLLAPLDEWLSAEDPRTESGVCDYLVGAFFAVSRTWFEKVGGFDERTFLYGEEPILGYRFRAAGGKEWYQNGPIVWHCHGQTIKNVMNAVQITEAQFHADLYFYQNYAMKGGSEVLFAKAAVSYLLFKKRISVAVLHCIRDKTIDHKAKFYNDAHL
jgi:GT2 family glycosyltransferase